MRSFGPWLEWGESALDEDVQVGWKWVDDGQGNHGLTERREEAEVEVRVNTHVWIPEGISERTLDGRWVALYNERTGQVGPLRQFEGFDTLPLTVPSRMGDELSLHIFSQPDAARPALISSTQIIAPSLGWGVRPSSEGARVAWRTAQWETALDDPLEITHLLTQPRVTLQGEMRDEVRSLVIAHPRSYHSQLSGSLRFAEELRIGVDQPPQVALYDLTPYDFLFMSQAYEPLRAWGEPWLDWDDLDQLAESQPPFTRNTQLLLSRPTTLGGYHALRLPWRENNATGLSLPATPLSQSTSSQLWDLTPLPNLTINLIGTFMNSLHRASSSEELDVPCLQWLTPSVQACSHFTITDRDLP